MKYTRDLTIKFEDKEIESLRDICDIVIDDLSKERLESEDILQLNYKKNRNAQILSYKILDSISDCPKSNIEEEIDEECDNSESKI